MLKILNKRERITLGLTVAVIMLSFAFNFLALPVLKQNYILNREIIASRAKLAKYLRLLSQKEAIQDKFQKFSDTYKISLKQEDALVSALTEIQNLAQKAEIKIVDIRPQVGPKSATFYKEATFDLKTEGEMEEYLNFVYSLENSLSLLKIKRFVLTARPNTTVLEGSFTISQVTLSE
jgi:hypothetical protein